MGNKHSSSPRPVPYSSHKHIGIQTDRDYLSPVSHASPTCHNSQPSLTKSMSSPEIIWSENLPRLSHLNNSHSPRKSTTFSPLLPSVSRQDAETRAYGAFLKSFPEYRNTWILDTLRKTDFARLDRTGETYVDYMGGAQHPESLVRVHISFLNESIMGNTHSVSNRYAISISRPATLLMG